MALRYCDLDTSTRRLMLEELTADAANSRLYICSRLTEVGEVHWPVVLRWAIEHGDDATLAADIQRWRLLEVYEVHYRGGRPCRAKVPHTAAAILAEGEFNRYYCRAICLRSLAERGGYVEVYRAKVVKQPRPQSEWMLGTLIDAQVLLDELRRHSSIAVTMGIVRPNSGLSVKLPARETWSEVG